MRPFANLQSQHQQRPTSQIHSTYMLSTFLASMLITITVVVKLLAAMEELSHHGIWATAHSAALSSHKIGCVSIIT
jgi:hypothetical protein